MTELHTETLDSPIGQIVIVYAGDKVCALDYADYTERMNQLLQRRYQKFQLRKVSRKSGVTKQLKAYLAGELDAINSITVDTGGTSFQQRVWTALRGIPSGTTWTYGEVATQLGTPRAYRAVGAANALNPIAIIVPCHRLVGANGALTGYAGGLERKEWLLMHEGVSVSNLKTDLP